MNNTAYPDQGQTIRQPATALFGIDSADRYTLDRYGVRTDKQPEYNFTLYKGQSVLNGFIKRLGLTEVNMEWNVPNVNSYNNKFAIRVTDYSGTDLSGVSEYDAFVTIPTGFYTPTELALALQTAINTDISGAGVLAAGKVANVVVEIDPKTLYVIIKGKGNNLSGARLGLNLPATLGVVPIENMTMYEMLGLRPLIDNGTLINSFPSTTIWYGSYASYLYTRYIDIVSDNLTKKQEVKDSTTQPPEQGGSNMLARVYLPTNQNAESRYDDPSGVGCNIIGTRPFVLYKEFNTPKYIYWDSREFINLIDIKVYDDQGRPLFEPSSELIPINTPLATWNFVAGNTAEFQISILASEN